MLKGVLIYLISPLVSAFSQLLLKKAADDRSLTGIRVYAESDLCEQLKI